MSRYIVRQIHICAKIAMSKKTFWLCPLRQPHVCNMHYKKWNFCTTNFQIKNKNNYEIFYENYLRGKLVLKHDFADNGTTDNRGSRTARNCGKQGFIDLQ